MNHDETIRQIIEIGRGKQKIAASDVRKWLSANSIKVTAAVINNVISQSRRIEPPLSMEEICSVMQEYFKKCLVQNFKDDGYLPNRHVAGYELVSWFKMLWNDPNVPRDYLDRLKKMFRAVSQEGLVSQEEMVSAVLEHLFESREIVSFFDDWRADPVLSKMYDLALKWAQVLPDDNPSS